MIGLNIDVHKDLIESKISEIDAICEHIIELKDELQEINDSCSEGEYYTKYLESIACIQQVMFSSEIAIRGYINTLSYVKDNYMTLSTDLANALKNV